MIPKIVHYVWLGGKELNPLGQKCLASWEKYLPGWEIRRWDESNSPVDHPFVRKMLREGKYAFASDYVRLHALVQQGGLYVDTDLELKKRPPSSMLDGKSLILGFHSVQNRLSKCALATCWIAAPPGQVLLRRILDRYEGLRRAVINNTFFTEEILPLFSGRSLPPGGRFDFLEAGGVRIHHRDLFAPEGGQPVQAGFAESVAVHHGQGCWGGPADPLPWWRRLYDFRLDRKILRPVENSIRKLRALISNSSP